MKILPIIFFAVILFGLKDVYSQNTNGIFDLALDVGPIGKRWRL